MSKKFAPQNWERLVSAERRALLDPVDFLDRIGVAPGVRAADLGAGPGFFTLPLAERVGPEGRVYAVDVAPEMIALLEQQPLPPQVEVALSRENEVPIADGVVDLALLAFVLHELEQPTTFLAEVARTLAPGGRLVVLEWVPQREPLGPPLEDRISMDEAARVLDRAGFAVVERGAANASNYFLVARTTSSQS